MQLEPIPYLVGSEDSNEGVGPGRCFSHGGGGRLGYHDNRAGGRWGTGGGWNVSEDNREIGDRGTRD